MMKNYSVLAVIFLVGMIGIAMGVPVTQSFTYQGKLTDENGHPLLGTNTMDMTFRLYSAGTGGTLYETDTHAVTVTDGLFTTPVTFDSRYFDGRALWLGIEVKSDGEMTPRQELRPVPYALSLRPGAILTGAKPVSPSMPSYVLKVDSPYTLGTGIIVSSTGDDSPGIAIDTAGAGSPALIADSAQDVGVYGIGKEGGYFTTNQAGTSTVPHAGVNVSTIYNYNPGVYTKTLSDYSDAVHAFTQGNHSRGVNAQTTGEFSDGVHAVTVGPNSRGVYAYSAQDVGVYGIGKEGGFFTTNQVGTMSQINPGVNVSTIYKYNPGVRVLTQGDISDGVSAWTMGNYSDGVHAETQGDNSHGVRAYTHGNYSVGVMAFTDGNRSDGVSAVTEDDESEGVWAHTSGDYSDGVYVGTHGHDSHGVEASIRGDDSHGVNITTDGYHSEGVYAHTYGDYSDGVVGFTQGDKSEGLVGYATGTRSYGLYAYSKQYPAIYADTANATHEWGVYSPDYIGSAVGFKTEPMDIAEYMRVAGEVAPGTVLVIGSDGSLQPSTVAYDTRVAGIVSTAPGVVLGDGGSDPGRTQVALAGVVPCSVDASYGPIHPGDLLSTSDTPGHAMKAEPIEIQGRKIYPDGTILGKALGSLESGTGAIDVLVTLQ